MDTYNYYIFPCEQFPPKPLILNNRDFCFCSEGPDLPHAHIRVSCRKRATSLVGALPKKRLYSRLNCEALRHPTCWLAEPASIMVDNISRLATCKRSTF
jgi:hypothetical protein